MKGRRGIGMTTTSGHGLDRFSIHRRRIGRTLPRFLFTGGNMTQKASEMGTVTKGISFTWESLQWFVKLAEEGTIELTFPQFVRQAVDHELARYKKESIEKKKRKGGI